jgi:hypothetical protein
VLHPNATDSHVASRIKKSSIVYKEEQTVAAKTFCPLAPVDLSFMTENLIERGDSMKRKSLLLVLAMCLGVLMLCQVAWVNADTEPTVGTNLGNVAFSAPITAGDATYLGLASPAPFHLSDIKAPYVLIESMNTT